MTKINWGQVIERYKWKYGLILKNVKINQKLKDFVREIIFHQVNDTIDKEEETEAWREMSDFFGEQFETIILKIQTKHNENKNSNDSEKDTHKIRLELLERNKLEQEKKDMWDD